MSALAICLEPSQLLLSSPGIGAEATELSRDFAEAISPRTSVQEHSSRLEALFRAIEEAPARERLLIDGETVSQALALLNSLPEGIPDPTFAVEVDGQIGFDWDLGPQHVVTLNVGRGGMIGWASRISLESNYGRTPFTGALPLRIADLLGRLVE